MDSLDDFLEGQRLGEFDSSGSFTLDWSKARQGYRDFSRADPTAFLLKLLQSAFAARPHEVHISADSRFLQIEWSGGRQFKDADLQLLEGHLRSGEHFTAPRTIKHLARALLLLAGRDDLAISLETSVGGLALSPGGVAMRSARRPSTRIRVQTVPGATRLVAPAAMDLNSILETDIFSPLLYVAWPELSLIRDKLGCHPVPLRLNGRQFAAHGRLRPETLVATRVHFADDPANCGLGFDTQVRASDCRFLLANELECKQIPAHYLRGNLLASSSYFDLGFNQGKQGRIYRGCLQLIADGIPVYESTDWLGQSGISLVMDVSQLPVDASTLGLVQGAEWQDCLTTARRQLMRFFDELEKKLTRTRGFVERMLTRTPLEQEGPAALRRCQELRAAWQRTERGGL